MPPILYLGPKGTHSHDAALTYFGDVKKLKPCLSHHDIFAQLSAGKDQRGGVTALVPVENSTEGPVTQTLDLLAAHPEVSIIESFSMPIKHHLIAHPAVKSTKDIKKVYSHPQALGQCRVNIDKRLPHVERIAESSTAASAARVALEPYSAALASETAARLYGLKIMKRNMQSSNKNVTRFLVLSTKERRTKPKNIDKNKVRSLVYVVLHNRPGALLHMLAPFDAAGVNLTFIQSRPLPGRPWEYAFFIEAVTNWQDPAHAAAWQLITALSESGRQMGTYIVK
ncbi:MAG: prephenate dehydratase [Kiritimatiellae bacterium]|jgi:chorismate mutase/prephenate dehydratase|nr:prephenate dehydratase [Kiritimatiellia bacterium]